METDIICTSRNCFIGLQESSTNNRKWEQDCSLDNYGLNDNENDFVIAL